MRKKTEITPEDFNGLLEFLSPDPDEAAKKYEETRARLIKYFYFRGCFDPEALADETLNRLTIKLPEAKLREGFVFASYYFSFAANIFHEEVRKRRRLVSLEADVSEPATEETNPNKASSPAFVCLEVCLLKLSDSDRKLFLQYFSFESADRVAQRRKLAAEKNISEQKLYTLISNLRKPLRECVKKCLDSKKP